MGSSGENVKKNSGIDKVDGYKQKKPERIVSPEISILWKAVDDKFYKKYIYRIVLFTHEGYRFSEGFYTRRFGFKKNASYFNRKGESTRLLNITHEKLKL